MYGPTNVGKSYLASQVVASVQREGGIAAWIDTELSWDSTWVEKCGIDPSKVMVSQPTSGEEALDTARELMRAGVDLIVLDSIAGLVPSAVHNEDFSYSPMAWQARFVNSSLPRLLPNLKNGSAFEAINKLARLFISDIFNKIEGGKVFKFGKTINISKLYMQYQERLKILNAADFGELQQGAGACASTSGD